MPLLFHQSKVNIRFFKEKTEKMILGEILHYVYENLITNYSEVFTKFEGNNSEEKLLPLFGHLLTKALAYYQEPLPQRKNIFKKAFLLLKQHLFSKNFIFLKNLISNSEVFSEPSLFKKTEKADESQETEELRPDLLLKKDKEWILIEFKLHEEKGVQIEKQIGKYVSLLQKLFPGDTIKAYLVSFEPFNLEKKIEITGNAIGNAKSLSYPSQLKLFENIN